MWEPFCIICGFGRMNRQEEWLAHMAGHNFARAKPQCDRLDKLRKDAEDLKSCTAFGGR